VRSLWRPVLDRIAPYDAGPSLEALTAALGLETLVRLSANESPLGPSPRVVAAIREEAPRVHLYPDGGSLALRQGLAKRLGIAPEQVLAGNGADELLSLIATAAFEPGDEVVVPRPAFEHYTTVTILAGAAVR
jgi:histidinol-phosphate aminotransferase